MSPGVGVGAKIAPGWELLPKEILQSVEEEYMKDVFIYQFRLY